MRRPALIALSIAAAMLCVAAAAAKKSPSTAVTIQTAPNPVVYGSKITIAGQASGKNNDTARVTVYAKLAPGYTTAKTIGTTTTDASGHYTFATAPAQNADYFVKVHTAPEATSPSALVKVAAKVTLSLTAGAGHMFFGGFVLPNYSGKSVLIQRHTAHGWKKVASARLGAATSVQTALGSTTRSKFRKRLRLKSGTYRASFDPADGLRIANVSRKRKL